MTNVCKLRVSFMQNTKASELSSSVAYKQLRKIKQLTLNFVTILCVTASRLRTVQLPSMSVLSELPNNNERKANVELEAKLLQRGFPLNRLVQSHCVKRK